MSESIEDAVKSGDTTRVLAAIAAFERKGRWKDYAELAVYLGGVVLLLWWLSA